MIEPTHRDWRELCAAVANEHDPKNMGLLAEELIRALDERTKSQEITCHICNQPVDLTTDPYTDEDGKTVHENCYIKRLMSTQNDPPDPHHAE